MDASSDHYNVIRIAYLQHNVTIGHNVAIDPGIIIDTNVIIDHTDKHDACHL